MTSPQPSKESARAGTGAEGRHAPRRRLCRPSQQQACSPSCDSSSRDGRTRPNVLRQPIGSHVESRRSYLRLSLGRSISREFSHSQRFTGAPCPIDGPARLCRQRM